ncbi:MAG: PIN domain-containing protein [Bacteroidetes bacterium]|nr:PIN domain-containing protein [Bacteroidota bacterium]MBX7047212.1 PIN domain-containing protein [Ignavibacteria bacterium]
MKTLRVYLDTSVIGGCFDEEFEDASNKLIEEIRLGLKIGVVSEIFLKELEGAPIQVKELFDSLKDYVEILVWTDEVDKLSKEYLNNKVVTLKYYGDAMHISYATVYNVDVLVSWNFKHIVNYDKILRFNSINLANGYKNLQIYTPMEVISNV